MPKFIALLLGLTFLTACGDPDAANEVQLEDDVEASASDFDCPVDVSEADRYLYPACN